MHKINKVISEEDKKKLHFSSSGCFVDIEFAFFLCKKKHQTSTYNELFDKLYIDSRKESIKSIKNNECCD